MPNKHNCKKINIGVSNYNGVGTVYYISEENINKYNLPHWIRGCNSINSYHQTVSKIFTDLNLNIDSISSKYDINIYTLMTVINENKIRGIYYLKIDTEGHDTIILDSFYNDIVINSKLPHVI